MGAHGGGRAGGGARAAEAHASKPPQKHSWWKAFRHHTLAHSRACAKAMLASQPRRPVMMKMTMEMAREREAAAKMKAFSDTKEKSAAFCRRLLRNEVVPLSDLFAGQPEMDQNLGLVSRRYGWDTLRTALRHTSAHLVDVRAPAPAQPA